MMSRTLESLLNWSSDNSPNGSAKIVPNGDIEKKVSEDVYVEDNGWASTSVSWVRIVTCFVIMMCTAIVWVLILILLIPWPYERIRQGNIWGHLNGKLMMRILGNPIKIEGGKYSDMRAIYICNHASPLDMFLTMWLMPTGTVGVAKKEIVYYPLIGQLYVLANHIRIDRSNPAAAIDSMQKAARRIAKNNLSLLIFPEGTRSEDGRLLQFKKGFAHLAIQTRLPVIPVVFTGTHLAWRKGSMHVRPAPLSVRYLPPIKTDDWTADKINDHVKTVHDLFVKNLPESQKPILLERKENSPKS